MLTDGAANLQRSAGACCNVSRPAEINLALITMHMEISLLAAQAWITLKLQLRHLLNPERLLLIFDFWQDTRRQRGTESGSLVQSCWSQIRQAVRGVGCNAWVWCGKPAGCDNGYGTVYGYQQCTLKFQASLQALQPTLTETTKVGESDFSSGWIRKWHPPLQLSLSVCPLC